MFPDRYVAIQYPAIVENVEKAVQCLGGYRKITTDHRVIHSLEWNPSGGSNVFARPSTSKFNTDTYLVVRARRPLPDDHVCTNSSEDITFEILCLVPGIHQFFQLFDFQFHPMVRTDSRLSEGARYESIYDKLVPSSREAALKMFKQPYPSVETFCLPMTFSRFPQTVHSVLQPETTSKYPKSTTSSQNWKIGIHTRADRKQFTCFVNATDPFPKKPPPEAVRCADEKCPDMNIHEMFQNVLMERPLWSKIGLRNKLSLDRTIFQVLLPKFAFYINTGAWARLWCRYGYDPRKDPEAYKYQSVSVSFARFAFTVLGIPGDLARDEESWMMPSNLRTGRATVSYRQADGSSEYNPGVAPSQRQIAYQLCDIHLPEVQRLIETRRVADRTEADPNCGWLEQGTLEELREMVKNDYKRTVASGDRAEVKGDENMPSTSSL
uniref:Transcription factor IIIC subunit 5 HTH domain-containing protein n=1 Tax=Trichuris muris TaxID=70415 RepID=A0A5S6QC39_TRIMR